VVTLAQVAAALGRPANQLLELDRRALPLAFVEGSYETVVVRDRARGDTLDITLDEDTGGRADEAELRRRDRELADRLAEPLSPALKELVLRHPELPAVSVRVTRTGDPAPASLCVSVREITALAQEREVAGVDLAQEPEILD
jgi:hypothetical protein